MTMGGRPARGDDLGHDGSWASSDGEGQGFKDKVQRLLAGYSRNQKIAAVGAVVAVIVAVVAVSKLTGGTDWAPLYTDVSADDGGAIIAALDEKGVPHQLGAGGSTILVPADTVHETRLALADTDMPSDAKVGYGVLDSQGLTTSEFGQRVGYQRAMEGELARTIEALDSVDTAVVHLAIPEDQVFAVQDDKASASVLIRTRGAGLSEDQVRAVVNLVASSIEGMSTESVTVADSEGNVLAAPGQEIAGGAGGGLRQGQTAEFEASVKSQLEGLLASVVGPDRSKVTVSADLDWDETSVSKELFEAPATPPGAAPGANDLVIEESTRNETYTGAGSQVGGVLGPDTPAAAPAGGDSDYSLDEADVRYAVNRAVESTKKAPGAINQMSVAVLVDETAISAEQAQQLTATLAAGANIQDDRGDVLTVTRLPFDDSAAAAAQAELERSEAAVEAAAHRSLINNLVVGGFLFLLLLVAAISYRRAARRHRRSALELAPTERPALSAATSTMLDEADADDLVELTASTDELGDVEPAGDETGLVLAPLVAGAAALEPSDDRADRTEALDELIEHQPDEVAALLRGWLGDRRAASR